MINLILWLCQILFSLAIAAVVILMWISGAAILDRVAVKYLKLLTSLSHTLLWRFQCSSLLSVLVSIPFAFELLVLY